MRTRAVLLSLLLVGCGPEWPDTPEGRYRAHCARCHDLDGASSTARMRSGEEVDLRDSFFQRNTSDARIAQIVREGKGRMEAVEGVTAAEIDSIVVHVRRLGRPDLDRERPAD